MSDMFLVAKQLAAHTVLSHLDNGHNKPTTTTMVISEYSASHHCGAMISPWFRVRISGSDKNLA